MQVPHFKKYSVTSESPALKVKVQVLSGKCPLSVKSKSSQCREMVPVSVYSIYDICYMAYS